MGMNVGSAGPNADPEVMVDINTTPLIDVMLVLLIMLIITIPIQLHTVKTCRRATRRRRQRSRWS
jgi:biopolymer transport protein ExbD